MDMLIYNAPIRQGDTFAIRLQYAEDGVDKALPSGYDLVVGIYDINGNLIMKGSVAEETIEVEKEGLLSLPVNHQQSMRMAGSVYMEITITDADLNVVDHAAQIVKMNFEHRRNNALL